MILEMHQVSQSYNQHLVLDHITFAAEKGRLLTIFGPSGSGKSTLLKSITGLLEIDKGSILLNGKDITDQKPHERGIAYVFQSPLLFPHLTVKKNIAFGLEVKKLNKKEIDMKVNLLLGLLKIEDIKDHYPNQISGGQQQRVSIARALAVDPAVILMDEPFSALDSALRTEMGMLIKSLQKKLELTIVFVTHDLNECLYLSDKIVLLNHGKIIDQGSTLDVYYHPKTIESAKLMGEMNWIHGKKIDQQFVTPIGSFPCDMQNDQKVILSFRPQSIKIVKNKEHNIFKVKTIDVIGREHRVVLSHDNIEIIVYTYPDHLLQIGDEVSLLYPSEHLHYCIDDTNKTNELGENTR